MPNRQYYCWKMCLKYQCGCVRYTSTQHVCNENRGISCNQWSITRSIGKDCDSHRISGLHDSSPDEDIIAEPPIQEELCLQEDQPDDNGRRRILGEAGYSGTETYEQAPRLRRAANS